MVPLSDCASNASTSKRFRVGVVSPSKFSRMLGVDACRARQTHQSLALHGSLEDAVDLLHYVQVVPVYAPVSQNK